jgi:predicted flap endonuclease-1-like 5' DNA nuclease
MLGSTVLFVVGVILGLLAAWFMGLLYWRRRIEEREVRIVDLRTALAEKGSDLLNVKGRLREQQLSAEQLRAQVVQSEQEIQVLGAQLEDRSQEVSRFVRALAEGNDRIFSLKARVGRAEARVEELNALLSQQQVNEEVLRSQVGQSEQRIRDLELRLREKDQVIGHLELAVSEQDRQNENLAACVEEAEIRAGGLAALLHETEQEVVQLRAEVGAKDAAGNLEKALAAPSRGAESPMVQAVTTPSAPDNLRRIEGIGPKISGLLNQAGITTFGQLAETGVSRLQQIVKDAGLAMADPGTWPEQASLAAQGQWCDLEVLQDELKWGRRA